MKASRQSIDAGVEQRLLHAVSGEEAWDVVEVFSSLVRISGSKQEREAADYIVGRLQSWGVPHRLLEPELYLSLPVSAEVKVTTATTLVLTGKTPSFSISTGQSGLSGEVVYVPRALSEDMSSLYAPAFDIGDKSVKGKIVLTEGMSGPDEVSFFSSQGAIGQIFVNPGDRVHWSTCTSIWGTPDLDTIAMKPTAVAVDVNHNDGEMLIRLADQGTLQVTLRTELEEGWYRCPLVVADVPGTLEPDKFLLAHGHLDSWDVGVGDNATGDAALLELARIFWNHRADLKRGLRIAWWPGHSTGRYAGSTWYADHHGLDLLQNCIAHMNIDSPGCRWADSYDQICWMAELEGFCEEVIRDVTGQEAQGERPYRAGDYSFNNIGLSGFFMLLSEIPEDRRQSLGYYAVGGCGGNIGWHTEDDRLEIADKDNLERDIKVYAAAINRMLNSTVYPFDFLRLAEQFEVAIRAYDSVGAGHFDLLPALRAVEDLRTSLRQFYVRLEALAGLSIVDERVRRANEVLLALTRLLVAIGYSRTGFFRQDPALSIQLLPDLSPIQELSGYSPTSDAYRFCRTQLIRGQNRVISALYAARRLVEGSLKEEGG